MWCTDSLALLLLAAAPGRLACEMPLGARYRLGGVVGERLEANRRQWLLPAPEANPGLIGMFHIRDRVPRVDWVPWAGEFAGKYLIGAVQAWRMTDDPALEATVRRLVADLADAQAEDGYLGPFPKEERLLGHWDLWGHYHLIIGLLMWHAETGDATALDVARRIGDAVCRVYLGTERRVSHAGSPEMNMAVLTGLVRLHRVTGEERYLQMAREIERDWEQAGDYFRQGLANVPFCRTPRPRWESLHDIQGLLELYRITGDGRYRTAFQNLWRSIRALDVHNTGGFSTGEQAIGDPYAPGAIETCCTVAWMALTIDMLHLTGDSRVADELERSFYNGGLGAQHPSGRWWTYNTPMDGRRLASAHEIVFQARAGTPELNCCSANAPRILGSLSEWAVLRDEAGLFVCYYGPGTSQVVLADGLGVTLRQETGYPCDPRVLLVVEPAEPHEFTLRLRIPSWSAQTAVTLNGEPVAGVSPGSWLPLHRRWLVGDRIELVFDFGLRAEPGDGACAGRSSFYRGPLLLAWDPRFNAFDEPDLPTLDPDALAPADRGAEGYRPRPWLLVEVGPPERRVTLCDFASAGAAGEPYRTWLPSARGGPAAFRLLEPAPGAAIPPGPLLLRWAPPILPVAVEPAQTLTVRRRGGEVVHTSTPARSYAVVSLPVGQYEWQIVRRNAHGERAAEDGWGWFEVTEGAPPQAAQAPTPLQLRDDGVAVDAPLRGTGAPLFGEILEAVGLAPAEGPTGEPAGAVAFDGAGSKLVYRLGHWPPGDYSAVAWFRVDSLPTGRIAQVTSAWCHFGDDPLRITIDGGHVYARIEGAGFWGTPGAPVEVGRWYHVAAVREHGRLRLYLDGELTGECALPPQLPPSATEVVGVGCNPRFGGNEGLPGRVAGFRLYGRALSPEEVARLAR